ncbi:GldG family protein [Neobittarella massiliensis]|uniref:GldG family protein n=2 Tax=Oscillospiraceae TaxID=216572 RepID=A0A8J6IG84_9FIRM|nr:GldG family protein [Neobittarella massiliensis]MBC3516560.1 GldG family protein [Neobittarella massiliensis]SCJ75790.1 gliding-associated putative ABC transporter substrate-binding component GldG [uncultured Anaerotruncus sp.]
MKQPKTAKSRKFRYGSFATLLTVGVIVLAVAVNVVMGLLSDRFSLTLDLTPSTAFKLSDESKEVLGTLTEPVTIYVLNDESTYVAGSGQTGLDPNYSQANEMFKLFAGNKNVTLEYVNMVKDPSFKSKFPDLELNENDVIISSSTRNVHIGGADLFNLQTTAYGSRIISSKAESTLASGILIATSKEATKVTVLTGHDEFTAEPLSNLLQQNSFDVDTQNIVGNSDPIRPESSILILCGPKRDFTDEEIDKLDTFLTNGGDYGKTLLYFADSEQPELPKLESYLAEWGITVKPGVLFEGDNSRVIQSDRFNTIADFTQNSFTSALIEKNLFPSIPYCVPLEETNTSDAIKVSTLIRYGDQAGIYPEDAPSNWKATAQDMVQYPTAAAISTKTISDKSSYVAVFGSVNFINESLLAESSLGNAKLLTSLANTVTDRGDMVTIEPKRVSGGYLDIKQDESNMMFALFIVIVPVAVLGCGIFVYLRRRHL